MFKDNPLLSFQTKCDIMSVSPYTSKMCSAVLEPEHQLIPLMRQKQHLPDTGCSWKQKRKEQVFFIVVIWCFEKCCTLLLALVKWFAIPLIHMLDAIRIHR